jgi:hypothetical protein
MWFGAAGLEFEKAWRGLKGDPQQQAAYLLALQPSQLPVLLKQALNPAVLAAASLSLLIHAIQQQPEAAVALLEALTAVPRFDINLMSVPSQQNAELAAALAAAEAQLAASGGSSELTSRLEGIKSKYRL